MSRLTVITPVLFLGVVSAVLLAAAASAQSNATIGIVATDADTSGNSATSLGPLNACIRAETGSSVPIDLVVDAVPAERGVIGFQYTILFDPNVLTLTAVDSEFLLAAKGTYEPFEGLSDPLPDEDGKYTVIIADIASQPPDTNIESGAGVLSRLFFTAKAPGVSTVAPSFNPPDEYPSLIDNQNETIGVDRIGTSRVAVGRDCDIPPAATPVIQDLPPIEELLGTATPAPTAEGETPGPNGTGTSPSATPSRSEAATPTNTGDGNDGDGPGITDADEGDGGTSAGTIAAVAALAAGGMALAGGGAWLLIRRRSAAPPAM